MLIKYIHYFILLFVSILFVGCASDYQYSINKNPTKNNLIKSNGEITEVIIPIVDSANLALTIEYPDLKELFSNGETLYFATYKKYSMSQSIFNLYDIFSKNKIEVPYSSNVKSFEDLAKVKNLKRIKLNWNRNEQIAYKHIKDFNIFVKIFYMRGIGKVKIQYTKDFSNDSMAKQVIKKEQIEENQKYASNKMGQYMIPACKAPKWDGETKDGIPYGQGCFTCAHYFGIFAHDYYRVCGEAVDGFIQNGTVYANISDGTILGYRTSKYKEDFSDPSEIKDLMIKLNNKAKEEWNEEQNRQRNKTYGSLKSSSKCDIYKSKCLNYCSNKSTKSNSLFSLGDKSDCKIGCKIAYNYCKSGDTSAWHVETCRAICKGANKQDSGLLPFSSSSYDNCVDNCIVNFFE